MLKITIETGDRKIFFEVPHISLSDAYCCEIIDDRVMLNDCDVTNLSVRAMNCIGGILRLRPNLQLRHLTGDMMLETPGCGEVTLMELIEWRDENLKKGQ